MTIFASISDEIDSSHTHAHTHTQISLNIYAVVIYKMRLFNIRNKITDMETGRVRQHSIAVVFDIQTFFRKVKATSLF